MGSALRRYKNAKAALNNVKNAKNRVKELLGRGGEIRVSNLSERKRETGKEGEWDAGFGRRKDEKERKNERRKENEERRKERKERKERKGKKRWEGGGSRRWPAVTGGGRSWPEKAVKAASPSQEWECKSSSF